MKGYHLNLHGYNDVTAKLNRCTKHGHSELIIIEFDWMFAAQCTLIWTALGRRKNDSKTELYNVY